MPVIPAEACPRTSPLELVTTENPVESALPLKVSPLSDPLSLNSPLSKLDPDFLRHTPTLLAV